MPANETIYTTLQKMKDQLGFYQVQIGPIGTPITMAFYEKWIAENFHADMAYLKEHLPTKKDPTQLNSNLKSVITISQPYFPAQQLLDEKIPARTALYAQNKDYHFWLKEKLQQFITELKNNFPEHEFLPYVDSGPILERNWAYENGLGWFGKNTCLIHPQFGSLFFIAEILTTLPESDFQTATETKLEPLPDFCGKCRKCIDICPTNALVEPHVLKAERCISYLTIESKTAPPLELRPKIQDWFFGCDLCQTTCPWNEKVFRLQQKNLDFHTRLQIDQPYATSTEKFLPLTSKDEQKLEEFFKEILTLSNKQLAKKFTGTPLFRAGGNGLKRNALIVIANRKMTNLKSTVAELKDHPKWAELIQWTLNQLA